MNFLKTK